MPNSSQTTTRISLDDLYCMTAYIYSEQNAVRSIASTFGHFVEVCGMLTIHSRKKLRDNVSFEDALCKALGWYFPLLAKFNVISVAELVFRKYPRVCPYCREVPHKDSKCKTVRGTERTVDHAAVRKYLSQNRGMIPVTLNDWQDMFQEIYPRTVEDTLGRSALGLFEELGELAEAIRVYDRYPKYLAGEAADVFSYIMGIANEYSIAQEQVDKSFSFETEYLKRYPGLCIQCGHKICICPYVPEATVGRLAKELDLSPDQVLFAPDMQSLHENGPAVASKVLELVGGTKGLVGTLPFDRGEANRALIVLCMELAKAISPKNKELAEQLQGAAIKIANSVAPSGSREHPFSEEDVFQMVLNVATELGAEFDLVLNNADNNLVGQIGKLMATQYRILLVLSNPADSNRILVSEEANVIRECIGLLPDRNVLKLEVLPACSINEFRRSLMDGAYEIIHFAGHGSPSKLLFQSQTGGREEILTEALGDIIKKNPKITCAIFNACYSVKNLTKAIAPYTIGMDAPVSDPAAHEFTRGFYDALGRKWSIDDAIENGKSCARQRSLDLPIVVLKS